MKILSRSNHLLFAVVLTSAVFTGCKKSDSYQPKPQITTNFTNPLAQTASVSLTQTFEVGSTSPKTSYDVSPTGSSSGDNVTLNGKSWNLYDAVIGNLSGDLKNGSWAARIRNTGKITMLFDVTTGISTVTIKNGTYSSDGASTWGLFYSTNSGSTWTQSGSNITTTSTLTTKTFTINITGTARLEIRKLTGGTNRIDIDDIAINDNTDGGTGGGGGTVLTGKKVPFRCYQI